MARAKTDPTRIDDAASKAPSTWLLLEEVFARWYARLGSGLEAVDELYDLLCDPETCSAKHKVSARGKEIRGTSAFLGAMGISNFWQDLAHLSLRPDAGGVPHLVVNYTDDTDVYLRVGHWKYFVRRTDVERWERLHPWLAAPPSTAAPAVSEVATQDVSREAQGVDLSNTGAGGRPTATNQSTTVRKRRRIKETRVLEVLRELDSKCRVRYDMQPAEVERIVMPRYRPRYGEVSRRVIARAYQKHLKERSQK